MKARFKDFLESGKYAKYGGDKNAEYIFEDILSRDDNIIAMIDASNVDKPALSVCIEEVERYHDSQTSPTFNLNDNYTKQALGYMVRVILKEFGYTPYKQKDMPKSSKAKYVASASTYKKTHKGTMKVIKKVVPVDEIS